MDFDRGFSSGFSPLAHFVLFSVFGLESRLPATGLREPKSPKVPGRVPGKGDCWWDCWEQCWEAGFLEKQRNGTAPSSPPSSALFPGTLPNTLPSTSGDLGLLSTVAGGRDSNFWPSSQGPKIRLEFCRKIRPSWP